MEHFRYINTIRKPDGTLRDWKEHNALAFCERFNGDRNYIDFYCRKDQDALELAYEIIDKEYEKRS